MKSKLCMHIIDFFACDTAKQTINLIKKVKIEYTKLRGRLHKTHSNIANAFLPIIPSSTYQLLHKFIHRENT